MLLFLIILSFCHLIYNTFDCFVFLINVIIFIIYRMITYIVFYFFYGLAINRFIGMKTVFSSQVCPNGIRVPVLLLCRLVYPFFQELRFRNGKYTTFGCVCVFFKIMNGIMG